MHVLDYTLDLENVKLLQYRTSEAVLDGLQKGDIDVALIERKAYTQELEGLPHIYRNQPYGYTLIGKQPQSFQVAVVRSLQIGSTHTPRFIYGTITNYESLERALAFSEVVLIRWDEFTDAHTLVTPLISSRKHPWFVAPHIYAKSEQTFEFIDSQIPYRRLNETVLISS